MKKISNSLFAYFSLLTMLVGFFLPNFNYVVKATEVEDNIVLNNNYELVDNDKDYNLITKNVVNPTAGIVKYICNAQYVEK